MFCLFLPFLSTSTFNQYLTINIFVNCQRCQRCNASLKLTETYDNEIRLRNIETSNRCYLYIMIELFMRVARLLKNRLIEWLNKITLTFFFVFGGFIRFCFFLIFLERNFFEISRDKSPRGRLPAGGGGDGISPSPPLGLVPSPGFIPSANCTDFFVLIFSNIFNATDVADLASSSFSAFRLRALASSFSLSVSVSSKSLRIPFVIDRFLHNGGGKSKGCYISYCRK
jgi:hypothetical protein